MVEQRESISNGWTEQYERLDGPVQGYVGNFGKDCATFTASTAISVATQPKGDGRRTITLNFLQKHITEFRKQKFNGQGHFARCIVGKR